MPPVRFAGPCVKCDQPDPSGYYKKKLCNNCYKKERRRARGLKRSGNVAKKHPCPVCGETKLRIVKGMCNRCYRRIDMRGGNVTPRRKYTGPCLDCGKMDDPRYYNKLCNACYKRKQYEEKVKSLKRYCACGIEISRLSRTGRCQSCQYKWRYQNNPKYREYMLQLGHKRNARKAGVTATLTQKEWERVLEHFGHACVYCGTTDAALTVDHYIPLSKGGTHSIDNVVPACLTCNIRKKDGPPPFPVATLQG